MTCRKAISSTYFSKKYVGQSASGVRLQRNVGRADYSFARDGLGLFLWEIGQG
jgi:hypothetical protein